MAREHLPPLSFIRSAITQGINRTNAYRQFTQTAHEQGLVGVRRSTFSQLFSEEIGVREQSKGGISADRFATPDATTFNQRTTVSARGYGQWVKVYYRNKGEDQLYDEPWLIKSSEPLTPYDAESQVGALIAQHEGEYDKVFVAAAYMTTDQYTPGVMP